MMSWERGEKLRKSYFELTHLSIIARVSVIVDRADTILYGHIEYLVPGLSDTTHCGKFVSL